jgi:hypothetical protein
LSGRGSAGGEDKARIREGARMKGGGRGDEGIIDYGVYGVACRACVSVLERVAAVDTLRGGRMMWDVGEDVAEMGKRDEEDDEG